MPESCEKRSSTVASRTISFSRNLRIWSAVAPLRIARTSPLSAFRLALRWAASLRRLSVSALRAAARSLSLSARSLSVRRRGTAQPGLLTGGADAATGLDNLYRHPMGGRKRPRI